jgi:hypothetical protein
MEVTFQIALVVLRENEVLKIYFNALHKLNIKMSGM